MAPPRRAWEAGPCPQPGACRSGQPCVHGAGDHRAHGPGQHRARRAGDHRWGWRRSCSGGGQGRAMVRGWARRFVRALPLLMIVGGLCSTTSPAALHRRAAVRGRPADRRPVLLAGRHRPHGRRRGPRHRLAAVGQRHGLLHVVPVIELVTVITVAILAVVINGVVRRSNEQLASARVIAETAMRAVLPAPVGADRRAPTSRRGTRRPRRTSSSAATCSPWRRARTGYGSWSGTCAARGSRRSGRWPWSSARSGRPPSRRTRWRAWRGGWSGRWRGRGRGSAASIRSRGSPRPCSPRSRPAAAEVRIVNRGHPEPLLLHPDGALDVLVAVGARAAARHGPGSVGGPGRRMGVWPPGRRCSLYTDGLSEARDPQGVFYDPAARLRGRIFPGPEELLSALADDVRLHTGGTSTDDMALLAVERPAEGQPEQRTTVKIVGRDAPAGEGNPGRWSSAEPVRGLCRSMPLSVTERRRSA